MAITEAEPNLSVQIHVNGEARPEYDDDNDSESNSPSLVEKYIEATTGAEFSVKYHFESGFNFQHDVSITVYVDGHRIIGRYANAHGTFKIADSLEENNGQYYTRNLSFSELLTGEGSDIGMVDESLSTRLKNIGLIRVTAHWVRVDGTTTKLGNVSGIAMTKITGRIPEKALKGRALSNQVVLGDPRLSLNRTIHNVTNIGTPIATFKFRYRSKKDLQSLMILPRDVSPRSDVQSGANSTIEEARNKVTQRVRMGSNEEEGSQAVKIKGGERQCSPRVKLEHIKRERSPGTPAVNADDDEVAFVSASKRRRVAMTITINEEGVETIDLT